MNRKIACVQVTDELLREVLALPAGTTIVNIQRHGDLPDVFVFYLEHPDFSETEAGEPLELLPIITVEYEESPAIRWPCRKRKRADPTITIDWNLPNEII